jgi:hypothetical protein
MAISIPETSDGVPPMRQCGHGMKEFGTLITKFYFVADEPFPPINISIPEKSL